MPQSNDVSLRELHPAMKKFPAIPLLMLCLFMGLLFEAAMLIQQGNVARRNAQQAIAAAESWKAKAQQWEAVARKWEQASKQWEQASNRFERVAMADQATMQRLLVAGHER